MPNASEFLLASCQATVFTPDEEVSSAKLLGNLLPQWISLFNGEPVVLPLPPAVPREVPRVILQDTTGAWRCEIASSRASIYWRKADVRTQDISLSDFFAEAAAKLVQYQEFQRARVGRLATVINRFSQHASPGMYLARHFCQEHWLKAPFNRPAAFELHAHKQYELQGFRLNSWVRNKTAELGSADGGPRSPILLIEQDLNTFPEDEAEKRFSHEDIRRFYEVVVPELNGILDLYYPRGLE